MSVISRKSQKHSPVYTVKFKTKICFHASSHQGVQALRQVVKARNRIEHLTVSGARDAMLDTAIVRARSQSSHLQRAMQDVLRSYRNRGRGDVFN